MRREWEKGRSLHDGQDAPLGRQTYRYIRWTMAIQIETRPTGVDDGPAATGAVQASTVHLVPPGTPGAERYQTGDASIRASGGSIELRPASSSGGPRNQPLTVVGTPDEIVALLKADRMGSGVWLAFESAKSTLPGTPEA